MQLLEHLEPLAPSGYALAFHIRFTTPTFLLQTYPKAWTDLYSQNGYVMSDPTVAWGFESTGTARWSDLAPQSHPVMQASADHGLVYGVTCAVETDGSRSLCSFSRADREFTDAETADLADHVAELHRLTTGLDAFSPIAAERLRKMSVRLTHPGA